MYWQLLVSMRKFDPLSDAAMYMLSSIAPVPAPPVRTSEIVAGGNWQVGTPPWVSVNFTGTTPRLTLNTLDPSGLMGCWTWAAYCGAGVKASFARVLLPL